MRSSEILVVFQIIAVNRSLQRRLLLPRLSGMKLLATWNILLAALCLTFSGLSHGNELEEVDGPNVRVLRLQDGSKAVFIRSPDNRVLTKKTFLNGWVTMVTIYKMDSSGNPLGCKIFDGQKNELFKVSYGYHKSTGLLEQERMFDSRVVRKDPNTGREMPVQIIRYLYDAEGKRSAPMVFNLLPGKKFEEVFGVKSSALETNPFNDGKP